MAFGKPGSFSASASLILGARATGEVPSGASAVAGIQPPAGGGAVGLEASGVAAGRGAGQGAKAPRPRRSA